MSMVPYKPKFKVDQLVKFSRKEGTEEYGIVTAVTFFRNNEVAYDIDMVNTQEIASRVFEAQIIKAYRDDT